jgi:hypothetical protein
MMTQINKLEDVPIGHYLVTKSKSGSIDWEKIERASYHDDSIAILAGFSWKYVKLGTVIELCPF